MQSLKKNGHGKKRIVAAVCCDYSRKTMPRFSHYVTGTLAWKARVPDTGSLAM